MGTDDLFYTYGPERLLAIRKHLRDVSFQSASARVTEFKLESVDSNSMNSTVWENCTAIAHSQVGDSRPLSSVALSLQHQAVAVGGFSGDVNVFSTASRDLRKLKSLRAHKDRCCGVAWSPFESNVQLASGGADSKIMLWNIHGGNEVLGPSAELAGHELRVNRVAYHPKCANLLASTSDDETWRLWDLERMEEVLLQEGHIGGVIGLAMHPDGSLVSTSDTVGVIRVWDMRSGRSILSFEGHAEQVVGLDFSPNGFTLASCSGDNSVRIWDLRKKKGIEELAWHDKLVSSVKFNRGDLLMTAGFDCVARICRTSDFKIVKNFPIHESRIMGADFAQDGSCLVTACYDRTFKVWTPEAKTEPPADMKQE